MATKPKFDITKAFSSTASKISAMVEEANAAEEDRGRVVDDPFTEQDYKKLIDDVGKKDARSTLRSNISDESFYSDESFQQAIKQKFGKIKDVGTAQQVAQLQRSSKIRNAFIDDVFKDDPFAFTSGIGQSESISSAELFEQGALIGSGDKPDEALSKVAGGLRRRDVKDVRQQSELKSSQRARAQQQGALSEGQATPNAGLLQPASLARKRLTRNRFFEAGGV
jgi:hypothetical protein